MVISVSFSPFYMSNYSYSLRSYICQVIYWNFEEHPRHRLHNIAYNFYRNFMTIIMIIKKKILFLVRFGKHTLTSFQRPQIPLVLPIIGLYELPDYNFGKLKIALEIILLHFSKPISCKARSSAKKIVRTRLA